MSIYDYFEDYNDKFYKMKDKLVELQEMRKNFVSLTGTKFNDMPNIKTNKNFDFGDQLVRIEKAISDYKKIESEYLEEREKCINAINKVTNPKYRTILKLFFIEKKNLKSLSIILNKNYKLEYSVDYIKKLKTKSIKEFEKVTFFHEKSPFSTKGSCQV